MRRISKVKPKEISMCFEGANRRLIATYKSKRKSVMDELDAKKEAGKKAAKQPKEQGKATMKKAKLESFDVEHAIANTNPRILGQLTELAKSVGGEDGRGYTPQAASIIKAVGRLIAPFSGELTLSDLAAIGKAAGLGVKPDGDEDQDDDVAPAFQKSVAKGEADEDDEDEDYDEDDAAEDEGPQEAEDEEDDDDEDEDDTDESDDDVDDDEDEEEVEEDVNKASKSDFALARKNSDDINKAARDDSDDEDEDDEDDKESDPDKGAPPWMQGRKAKGAKMGKTASANTENYSELRKQRAENLELREELRKTKAYFEQERNERQIENIKKSVREDFSHLAIDEERLEVLAPMLKSMRESEDQKGYEHFTAMLKSWNDQVNGAQKASGIFGAIGKSSAQAAARPADAEARIEARVDEEMAKSTKKELRAVVYDRFLQSAEGRELHKTARREKGGL